MSSYLKISALPPILIYFVASSTALTQVAGLFYLKDFLNLDAVAVAGLSFWVALPWSLKLIAGHLADVFWRFKYVFVVIGAALISAGNLIIWAVILSPEALPAGLSREEVYLIGALLPPVGFVLQDVVADALTVEAVDPFDLYGRPLRESQAKLRHVTMQTLGRAATVLGFVLVSALNIWVYDGLGEASEEVRRATYAEVYMIAALIPWLSVVAVAIAITLERARRSSSRGPVKAGGTPPDPRILLGGGIIAATAMLSTALSSELTREAVFLASLAVLLYLLRHLLKQVAQSDRLPLVGTVIVIFAFRAMPVPGAAQHWFQIDVLGFDEQFFALLSLITFAVSLVAMFALRPLMANNSVASITLILIFAATLFQIPNIGLYYGLHDWAARVTGGLVDARLIAIADTAAEAPLAQIAIIPVLSWIAMYAPVGQKATFFALMASLMNLSNSASSLLTQYVNAIFAVTREVRDSASKALLTSQDYDRLGHLLIFVAIVGFVVPVFSIFLVQRSRIKTAQ